jgi:hypothetical protein
MKLTYEKYKDLLIKRSYLPTDEKEKIEYQIKGQILANVFSHGMDFLKNQILNYINVNQKANNVFKIVNILSEKPEVQKGIRYLINHKDFSRYEYDKIKDIVFKYAKTFPIITATNPDLLIPLIKTHLETGIVPIDYLKNLNDLELKYYR